MKKLNLIFLALVVTLLGACNKPNEDPDPTPELEITKKYLVKQTCDDEEQVVLSIDWSDNHSRIKHIYYTSGSPQFGVDYDFEYFEDSICVKIVDTIIEGGIYGGFNTYDFLSYTCRMRDGKIDDIFLYMKYLGMRHWRQYVYDEQGELMRLNSEGPHFEWNDGNVIREWNASNPNSTYTIYEDFDEKHNPFRTLPYLFPSFHEYGKMFLTEPLWKNNYRCIRTSSGTTRYEYDYDADGYAITQYIIEENGEKLVNFRYFYETEDD